MRSSSGTRLVTGEHLAGQTALLGNKVQQTLEGHFPHRLRSRPVELPGDVMSGDVIPLGVGVDSELDGGVRFGWSRSHLKSRP